MGRIFINAGISELDKIADWIKAAQQLVLLRDQIVAELRSQGCQVFSVPEDLSLGESIQWINQRAISGDIALCLYLDLSHPNQKGVTAFYISKNSDRKKQADSLLLALIRRLSSPAPAASHPDTHSVFGRLDFCRQVIIPSLVLKIGSWNNSEDRNFILENFKNIALGINEGLMLWNQSLTSGNTDLSYQEITIKINGKNYLEQGIMINNNPYIPRDLLDILAVNYHGKPPGDLTEYGGLVYLKAIELIKYNIGINWEPSTFTLELHSILSIDITKIDRIISRGNCSELQLIMFLKANNERALNAFPDLAKLYRQEAKIEGVNHDIAFCQMCLETDFLRFGKAVPLGNNNLAGLGSLEKGKYAVFATYQEGVMAHIQHLKAYGSLEPLVGEIIDPRFHLIRRGIAPKISQLSGRWSADLSYGEKLLALLMRLYESGGFI
jgi:hypothetical protein